MSDRPLPETAHDKPLFTPGPLTTSRSVKQAMLRDLGSRDREFIALVREIRDEVLSIGNVSQDAGYEAVLMQGSGTFGVEAVISSVVPQDGRLLALVNGAYGERIVKMARVHGIPVTVLRCPEDMATDPAEVERMLDGEPKLSHVVMVHSETTAGVVNPVEVIGPMVRARNRIFIVDGMSSFGAIETDIAGWGIDYLISSANKCIEGVPGFSFAICRRDDLLSLEGRARTLSLDLLAQWRGLEANGQFRFTPPTHTLLAFRQALREHADEGGAAGRCARYQANHAALLSGMTSLGFRPYLPPEIQGPIITSFHYPNDPMFRFEEFYERLSDKGFVIYPGKLSAADCFRIGSIGRIFPRDVEALVAGVVATLREMKVGMPVS